MKKRFMNALLLGALVFASTSTFVSCKDYDDDITNLQTQIDKLAKADELKAAVETLNTAVAGAKTDAAAALKAAQAAQATADKKADAATVEALQKSVNDAKAAAEKATADLEAAKTNLETLIASKADQADLDKANEKIAAAEAAIEAAKTVAAEADAALKAEMTQAIAEATKDLVDKAALAAEVQALEGKINSLTSDGIVADLGNLKTQVSDLEDAAKALKIAVSNMITGIQLFGTIHEGDHYTNVNNNEEWTDEDGHVHNSAYGSYWEGGHGTNNPCDHTLTFTTVAELDNVFTAPDGKSIEFKKGNFAVYGDSVVVRVTPANATLTKEMVSLVNSQGAVLEDVVVESVEKFNTLLTRAAVAETGLWTIKFNLKKDYDADAFKKAIVAENNKNILFAVAAKANVDATDENSNRSVVSEFDLDMNPTVGTKAKDFTVQTMEQDPIGLWNIRNRFYNTEEGINTEKREELVWAKNDADKGIETPAVAATADNTVKKADQEKYRYGYWTSNTTKADCYVLRSDDRNNRPLLISEVDKDIVIDYSVYMNGSYQAYGQKVAGFYVTLDKSHANESKPSEIEAWTKFEYEGLDKLFLGSRGTIKVTSPAAHGDVIGFRVFAVNLDGTLVDPDGRAFYVQVGEAEKMELGAYDAKFDAKNGVFTTGLVEVDNDKFVFEDYMEVYMSLANNTPDADGATPLPTIKFYNADKEQIGRDWNWATAFWETTSEEIKYIEIVIEKGRAAEFIDNATYTYELNIVKNRNVSTVLRTLTLTMKKVMPEAPGFAYLDAQDENQWVIPGEGNYKILSDEDIDEKNAYINLVNVLKVPHNAEMWHNDTQFDITVANSQYKENNQGKYVVAPSENIAWDPASVNRLNIMNSVITEVKDGKNVYAANLVDNTTAHAFAATYNFGYISKRYDADSKRYVTEDYKPAVTSVPKAVVFCSWTKNFSYDAASKITSNKETNKWWLNNTVTWKSTNPGEGDAAILNLGNVPTKIEGRVNENIKPDANTLGGLLVGNFLTVVDNKVSVETTNGASPYFTASYDGEFIKVTQKTDSQKPIKHNETLKFTVEDCFGNQIPVSLTIQVTVVD